MSVRLGVHRESWPMKAPFVITGHVFESLESVVVTLESDGAEGRGEGVPVYYLNESAPEMLDQIEAVRAEIEAGINRLPRGSVERRLKAKKETGEKKALRGKVDP